MSVADVTATFTNIPAERSFLRPIHQARICSLEERSLGTPGSSASFMRSNIRHWLTQLGVLTARPAAFAIFALYAVAWIAMGDGLEWHSLATLATWAMTWHPSVLPVKVSRFAIDDQTPQRDLCLSQEHCLFIDGVLIP